MSTDMTLQILSTDSADTERIGEILGSLLKGGEFINLCADLGGGKTTLVKGLARGMGSSDRVASPTFTLNRVYHGNRLELHHFDLYRLSDAGILMDQVEESISSPHVVVVVEWADIIADAIPSGSINISIKPTVQSEDERTIKFEYSENNVQLIKQLENRLHEAKP